MKGSHSYWECLEILLLPLYELLSVPANKATAIACYSRVFIEATVGICIDDLFIGTKNSLTNANLLDDGRIVLSGNGGCNCN